MANPEHVAKLKEGVKAWNEWRETDFSRIDPSDVGPIVDLTGADLSGMNLLGANFNTAILAAANLSGSDLTWANLRDAVLHAADLTSATLIAAELEAAALAGANLEGTTLGWTIFANCDLSEVRSLDLCEHSGPSTIGIDTFFKSKGQIPEAFLRGCGVPQEFITYAQSLVGQP